MNNQSTTDALKKSIRDSIRSKRRALDPDTRESFAKDITKNLLRNIPLMPQSVIGAYWSVRSEVNTLAIIEELIGRGHIVSLPVVDDEYDRLFFRRFRVDDPLLPGPFHMPQPLESAEQVNPHVLIVPLIGFTRDGHRLGYGKGYYDKTLSRKRNEKPITAIGVAYSLQEVDDGFPVEPHDEPLDWIITEKEVIRTTIE